VEAALSRELCETIIDDAHAAGFRRIQLTGGDPLICKFLPELVERAAPLFELREIYTNGLSLDSELLDRLAPHQPGFAFSYYSCDPTIHDAITRTPGSHRRTRAAIERAVNRGLRVRAAIVVLDQNIDTVDATFAELKSIGASVSASAQKGVGRGSAFAWTPTEVAGAAGHRTAGETDGKLAVTYDGAVVPCIFNRGRVLGRLEHGKRLRDVLADLAMTSGPARDDQELSCGSCRITDLALAALGGA
jgi:MoaA/NifB/PqqE/SkfB family radical SAM enzyme